MFGFPRETEHYEVVITVRNPYLRALSLWKHRYRHAYSGRRGIGAYEGASLLEFLQQEIDEIHRPIYDLIDEVRGFDVTKLRIVRLDRLRADLQRLPFWKPETVIPKGNPYRSEYCQPAMRYFTSKTKALVLEKYRRDFLFFSYDPGESFELEGA